ncbi:MAG: NAD(P)H-hydrate dehydratase [Hyphomicrobiales bacterium]
MTNEQMREADRLAMASGMADTTLMEHAGRGVFEAVTKRFSPVPTVVICGPGNNGGDGFVVARLLAKAGWPLTLGLLGKRESLKGSAATMAERWVGPILPAEKTRPEEAGLIVDALFGSGLARPLEGTARLIVERIAASGGKVVAVDIPSGLNADTGHIGTAAAKACLTVTFFRKRPGHLLFPGRTLCGETIVADIGMADDTLLSIAPRTYQNGPAFWGEDFPRPHPEGHKYDRGHAVVVSGGPRHTGAARLAARGALRIGAGLVTVASPREALDVNAAHMTAIMLTKVDDGCDLARLLADKRYSSIALGPGAGLDETTRTRRDAALQSGAGVVLDADAISISGDDPQSLYDMIAAKPDRPVVLTPHEGEFARLFPDLAKGYPSKLERARRAARRSGAVILLKGPDTVVAAPDGRAVINSNAPPNLATAGSGDVLCGFAAGLLAQAMPPFAAAAAAVWCHGMAGQVVGAGLIAEDLPDAIIEVLKEIDRSVKQ